MIVQFPKADDTTNHERWLIIEALLNEAARAAQRGTSPERMLYRLKRIENQINRLET